MRTRIPGSVVDRLLRPNSPFSKRIVGRNLRPETGSKWNDESDEVVSVSLDNSNEPATSSGCFVRGENFIIEVASLKSAESSSRFTLLGVKRQQNCRRMLDLHEIHIVFPAREH